MSPVTHFAQPLWLVVGAVAVPVILLLYWRFDQVQRRRVRALSRAEYRFDAVRRITPDARGPSAPCCALPWWPPAWRWRGPWVRFRCRTRSGAASTSCSPSIPRWSMLTPDVKPDRLTRAKLAVEDLLNISPVMAWAWSPSRVRCSCRLPVTTDYDAFRETLDALDTRTIALGGTDIASAIRLGESTSLCGETHRRCWFSSPTARIWRAMRCSRPRRLPSRG